jgi:WD40 repeat protein
MTRRILALIMLTFDSWSSLKADEAHAAVGASLPRQALARLETGDRSNGFSVATCIFSSSGTRLAVHTSGGVFSLWDLFRDKPILIEQSNFSRDSFARATLGYSCDEKSFWTLFPDDTIRSCDENTGRETVVLLPIRYQPDRIHFFSNGKLYSIHSRSIDDVDTFAIYSTSRKIALWTVKTKAENSWSTRVTVSPNSQAFSSNGKFFAAATFANKVYIWDLETSKAHGEPLKNGNSPQALAFSPDSRALLLGGGDTDHSGRHAGSLQLFDVQTGRELFKCAEQNTEVESVAFAVDGSTFAAASGDFTTRVWETCTGQELFSFVDHKKDNRASYITYSPDSRMLASCMSADASVLLWSLAPPDWSEASAQREAATQLPAWWDDLAGSDAPKAYRAVWSLSAVPERAVPFLRERLRPFPAMPADQMRQWLADLDAPAYPVRERASAGLAACGLQAAALLRQAQAATPAPSAEAAERIAALLQKTEQWAVTDAAMLRALRAVWVLERIGTPAARDVLQTLAAGAPALRPTQAARSALDRLAARK